MLLRRREASSRRTETQKKRPASAGLFLFLVAAATAAARAAAGVHDDEDDRDDDRYENCPENEPARPAPAGAPLLFRVCAHVQVLTRWPPSQTSGMEAPRWWTMRRAHS